MVHPNSAVMYFHVVLLILLFTVNSHHIFTVAEDHGSPVKYLNSYLYVNTKTLKENKLYYYLIRILSELHDSQYPIKSIIRCAVLSHKYSSSLFSSKSLA